MILVLSPKSKTRVSPFAISSRSLKAPPTHTVSFISHLIILSPVFHLLASIFYPPFCLHLHTFCLPQPTPKLLHGLSSIAFCHHQPIFLFVFCNPKPLTYQQPVVFLHPRSSLLLSTPSCAFYYLQTLLDPFKKRRNLDYSFTNACKQLEPPL